MEADFIPDSKRLKRGINELLNSWSSIIMASIENNTNTAPYHPYMMNGLITTAGAPTSDNLTSHINNNPFISPNDYKLEMSELSGQPAPPLMGLVTELDVKKNSISSYAVEQNEAVDDDNNQNKNNLDDEAAGEADESKKQRNNSQQQQLMAKNANKIFRPILNFIGVDAPSGTLIDNLFKEFGTLLFGNLNIKSVHINILGSAWSMSRLFDDHSIGPVASRTNLTSSQPQFRARSFYV